MGHTNLEDMRQGIDMFKWRKSFEKLESEGRPDIAGPKRGEVNVICPMSNNININISVSVNINLVM